MIKECEWGQGRGGRGVKGVREGLRGCRKHRNLHTCLLTYLPTDLGYIYIKIKPFQTSKGKQPCIYEPQLSPTCLPA